MKPYELTFLVTPELEGKDTKVIEKIKKLIADNGGKITSETAEGKKRLAYAIQKQDFALYYYYELDLPAPAPAKISSVLNITDGVMRYLLVSVDPRKEKLAAKERARKAQTQENNKEK